ncbi:MAG: hypothetical protein U0822_09960 [Anaerolineae bacterium]
MEAESLSTALIGARSHLDVASELDVILRMYELGARGNPPSVSIPIGRLALVAYDSDVYDYEGQPEVYRAGETVSKTRWRKGCAIVIEMREFPGAISLTASQSFIGISLTSSDTATVRLQCDVRVEDPIRLLAHEPNWQTDEGRERLKRELNEAVRFALESAAGEDIRLWSDPNIRGVAERIFEPLEAQLVEWGLRLRTEGAVAERHFPRQLTEAILELRGAEQHLRTDRRLLLTRLGLRGADLAEIEYGSYEKGEGAGLFLWIGQRYKRRAEIDLILEWLLSTDQSALGAAQLLKELYCVPHSPRERALAERVVIAGFRRHDLGLGEWGDIEAVAKEPALGRT